MERRQKQNESVVRRRQQEQQQEGIVERVANSINKEKDIPVDSEIRFVCRVGV